MRDPQDQIELRGVKVFAPGETEADSDASSRKWKSIWFRCCHVYGRMYRSAAGTEYVGHCPKCQARVSARVGPGGTSRRVFEAG